MDVCISLKIMNAYDAYVLRTTKASKMLCSWLKLLDESIKKLSLHTEPTKCITSYIS